MPRTEKRVDTRVTCHLDDEEVAEALIAYARRKIRVSKTAEASVQRYAKGNASVTFYTIHYDSEKEQRS